MNSNLNIKDIILSHTTQEAIYTRFLGLNSFPKKNISSPFSEDKKPSFNLYEDNSTIKFKCHSTGKNGDVFQFVAELKNLDCKTNFLEVANEIAKCMNINLQDSNNQLFKTNYPINHNNTVEKEILQSSNTNYAISKTPSTLSVETREFTTLDLEYWNNLGVDETNLNKYELRSISSYCWSGKKPIYTKKESVAFVFKLNDENKLYIPSQPALNIKKNVLPAFKSGIYGLKQLGTEKKESIIICAGEKDTIVANSKDFNAVTFGSESSIPKTEQIDILQNLCDNLFVCYDNDEAGAKGMNSLIEKFPSIIAIHLPNNANIKGYDIADYFQEYSREDFQKLIDIAIKEKAPILKPETHVTTIIHITEDYLAQHYDIRHNIIANEIEYSKKGKNDWSPCNENSLWIEMQKKSIKVPASTLEKILKSDFVPKFNPLIDYFENLPIWDGKTDYILQYANYITLATGEDRYQFDYHFKKWCVRSVKCATDDNYFNKNAFVLSDDGKGQNIGKTTWIRNLCPTVLSNYLVDNLPKDEKDAKIVLTQNFIVNLDELAALSKQEINTLKSLFSADKIKVRFPYDKKDTVVRRVGNFIGSTNQTTFLYDETGSVRWLCFVADKIDFSYKENFNIDNLWMQAYSLSKDVNFQEKLTTNDIKLNEERNSKFQVQTPEIDLIHKYLEIPRKIEEVELVSATEIQSYLNGFATQVRLTPVGVGKALRALGYTYSRNSAGGQWAIKKKELNP
ncbi:VapE domain-containing protein [Flavobacterium macrobrachii]|uniref:Zinc finger CHC2-type domain-containing protein n=1 Tax=Flavobacterium macrobrachii TaxID=591204 RepID=A0ABS2CVR2_9FLAO|nr:VapE domain-containing protein [Flavobacterium macrobrachii]MBM6498986.1 hypothetical protein [Flavobacterium macrobrachii]